MTNSDGTEQQEQSRGAGSLHLMECSVSKRDSTGPSGFSWDQRHKLCRDVLNLAPPDLAGVVLLIHNYGHRRTSDPHDTTARAWLQTCELPMKQKTQWEMHHPDHSSIPQDVVAHQKPVPSQPIQQKLQLDLQECPDELLHQLREYVDQCFVPQFVAPRKCNICEGLWCLDPVVCCANDGCESCVHEACFGVLVREGQDVRDGPWYCASCSFGRQLLCAVCMQTGGALKPVSNGGRPESEDQDLTSADKENTSAAAGAGGTNASDYGCFSFEDQKWAHAICALTIPEMTLRDVPTMEPVEGFDSIENGRFRYLCIICRKRGGACVTCEQENCNVGMHPKCAADAGYMLGSAANVFGVYCDRHVPTERIPGAKRCILDDKLVAEMVARELDETDGVEPMDIDQQPDHNDEQDLEATLGFLLESTPFLNMKSNLLGSEQPSETVNFARNRSLASWVRTLQRSKEASSSKYETIRLVPSSWAVPAMELQQMRTQKPLVFPPRVALNTPSLEVFPQGERLVGAIIDFLFAKEDQKVEWFRARVLAFDGARDKHLIHFVSNDQKGWTNLSTRNTLVLYFPEEKEDLQAYSREGIRIRVYRPLHKDTFEWRPKPRLFRENH